MRRFVLSVAGRFYAGWLAKFTWYVRSWASTAQIVRAILLASATVAAFAGRRPARRNAPSRGVLPEPPIRTFAGVAFARRNRVFWYRVHFNRMGHVSGLRPRDLPQARSGFRPREVPRAG